ncbi:MAG TPA: hypothetical protein VMS00_13350 [Acidimicrobiales bacterium]|nr:hypothetical protein [Acidimicrobiales bacterium]
MNPHGFYSILTEDALYDRFFAHEARRWSRKRGDSRFVTVDRAAEDGAGLADRRISNGA